MKRISFMILFSLFFFLAGGILLQAQTYSVTQTWGFESGSLSPWAFAGAYQSGDAPTGGVITPTDFSAHGGTHVVEAIKGSGCWQINLQLDGSSTIKAGDSLAFWVYPTVSDTTHSEAYQIFWQDGNWANWNSVTIPINMIKANQWNQVGLVAKSIAAPLNRIGIQTYPKATHADSTAIDTIYIDDITVYSPVDPALVTQWGRTSDGYGNGWPILNDSATAPGDASIGGPQPMATGSNGASIRGGFANLKPTMDTAVVVSGQLKFDGDPGSNYTALRYALTFLDSTTLNNQYTDTAKWASTRADKSLNHNYGWEFTPRSGTADQPNGGAGVGSVWQVKNGNWASTYSNGGSTVGSVVEQAPRHAVITAGTYNWAISVKQVSDTTDEIRWYLVKTDNSYWFGGSAIDTIITDSLNGISFWTKDGEDTLLSVTGVRAELGDPITVPVAPWQAYYLDQWGVTADGYGNGWKIRNDSNTVVGDASIGGGIVMATGSNGASVRGGFGQDITIPKDKAVILTGQMEFQGSPGSSYTALRYALTYIDSVTLQNPLTDSAKWASTRTDNSLNHNYGYEFTPRSGTADQPNGGAGVGSVWIVDNGNWASTYSNGGGTAGPVVDQAPRNAVITSGTYNWAISVQQVNDSTNEVRWSLVKEGSPVGYWFAGKVDAPAVTNKLNGIAFWIKNDENSTDSVFNIIAAKIDMGNPITIPPKPFTAYYVDQWGFNGGTGGWSLKPGEFVGDEIISGTSDLTGWAAVRGEFGPEAGINKDTALIITGNLEFDGGGFDASSSLRFGVFYSDSAGKAQIDSASDSSYVWTGTDNSTYGYLFLPLSGSASAVNWQGISQTGTWGAVVNGTWYSTGDADDYVLGSNLQEPAGATATAGTYDFAISIAPLSATSNDVRFYLTNEDGSYNFRGKVIDNHDPLVSQKFNSINFALNTNAGTSAMKMLNVKVDRGAPLDSVLVGVEGTESLLPTQYSLSQNYPNPFNPTTTIKFALPKAGNVSLVVYDILGRKVAELIHSDMNAGYHTVLFNASNFASGVYFYRLQAGSFVSVKKLMLLK